MYELMCKARYGQTCRGGGAYQSYGHLLSATGEYKTTQPDFPMAVDSHRVRFWSPEAIQRGTAKCADNDIPRGRGSRHQRRTWGEWLRADDGRSEEDARS